MFIIMKHYSLENIYYFLNKFISKKYVKLIMVFSRRKAHKFRKEVIKNKGKTIITKDIKQEIKEYSKQRFGTSAYWPYLALYTEIRGEFIKGWIPHDYYRHVIDPIWNSHSSYVISEQKCFTHRIFGDFSIQPLFIFVSEIFFNPDFEYVDVEDVKKVLCDYNGKIVVKAEWGSQGKQVRIMNCCDFNPESFHKGVNYVIQPYVNQYKELNELYPDSVNTFRVLTQLKPDGSVVVKYVYLRFGVDGSTVDNVKSGGQYLFFNLLGEPLKSARDDFGMSVGERHKNTNYLFSDLKIPMFQEILSLCKNAHLKYPYSKVIGWDVCVDNAGKPKLIEWNCFNIGIWRYEALFGPFWPNDEDLN